MPLVGDQQEGSAEPQGGNALPVKRDYTEYRKAILEAEPRSQQAFDKTVMALSSGALGVSFAFVDKIVRPGSPVAMSYIAAAWFCWVGSLTLVLVSHYFSALAMRKTVKQIDTDVLHKQHPGGWYDYAIVVLNPLGAASFVAGAILAGLFVLENVR